MFSVGDNPVEDSWRGNGEYAGVACQYAGGKGKETVLGILKCPGITSGTMKTYSRQEWLFA